MVDNLIVDSAKKAPLALKAPGGGVAALFGARRDGIAGGTGSSSLQRSSSCTADSKPTGEGAMKLAVKSTRPIPTPPYLPGQSPVAAPSLPGQGNSQQSGHHIALSSLIL